MKKVQIKSRVRFSPWAIKYHRESPFRIGTITGLYSEGYQENTMAYVAWDNGIVKLHSFKKLTVI